MIAKQTGAQAGAEPQPSRELDRTDERGREVERVER